MFAWFLRRRIKTVLFSVVVLAAVFVLFQKNNLNDELDESRYKIILWWTPFLYEDKKLITCENTYECVVTKNRSFQGNAAALLFYGSNFEKNDLPLPKNDVPWAIFHEESPKNLPFFLHKEGQEIFDITATFSRNSNLPLTLQYLEDLSAITDSSYYVPVREKNILLESIAPVLYLQSDCDTPIERDFYVNSLMKFVKIDSYGKCLNNKDLPKELALETTLENLYEPALMKFASRYKFTIAVENAVCHDYITEKLWRPLMAGSIPIYLGSPSVMDWLPNNRSVILVNDYNSISDLADHIKTLNSNDTLYEEYMAHKILRQISNHRLKNALETGRFGIKNNEDFTVPAFECFVCKKIHEGLHQKQSDVVYDCEKPKLSDSKKPNWWITHWESGKCDAIVLHYFLKILKVSNYTKDMFESKYSEFLQNGNC